MKNNRYNNISYFCYHIKKQLWHSKIELQIFIDYVDFTIYVLDSTHHVCLFNACLWLWFFYLVKLELAACIYWFLFNEFLCILCIKSTRGDWEGWYFKIKLNPTYSQALVSIHDQSLIFYCHLCRRWRIKITTYFITIQLPIIEDCI